MNNFSILKYILLSFAAVILLNTNVAAEQYYFGVEGGYALYDNMDEERQYLANIIRFKMDNQGILVRY